MKVEGIFPGRLIETLTTSLADSFRRHYPKASAGDLNFIVELQLTMKVGCENAESAGEYLDYLAALSKTLKSEEPHQLMLHIQPVSKQHEEMVSEVENAVAAAQSLQAPEKKLVV